MICAVDYLNPQSIDVVYGSSAGTVVDRTLLRDSPLVGPEVYYDRPHDRDENLLIRDDIALGFGLLDPRLFKRCSDTPGTLRASLLNLPFLLKTTVQDTKPPRLGHVRGTTKRRSKWSPGLKSEKAIVLDYKGAFNTLEELTDCMHASYYPVLLTRHEFGYPSVKEKKVPQKHVLGKRRPG
jgi:hypothetical protein